ncbi:hypothetical protein A5733_04310 [Mycobacterium sp. NS-7484]|uniref:WhiB family transcriptional regulator n=1 Tax=Mycobacterium sp. NS-7484 TaxID=1834161 RepID=UPI00096FEE3C|nr:WhiB family transcriptional regulator [Mycobacterium sp. NS-7484]OMC00340.1 hypothetical protein A5733_04310 [Mycobacterium sp. NS-7484]
MTKPSTALPALPANWDGRAECRRHNPELWFSHDGIEIRAAKALCRTECPIRVECGIAAVTRNERFGIYAGFDTADAQDWRKLGEWLGIEPPKRRARHRERTSMTCESCGAEFVTTRPDSKCHACRQGLVPAEPVREHIRNLRQVGFSYKLISKRAGVSHTVVPNIANPKQKYVTRETANRILALTATASAVAS